MKGLIGRKIGMTSFFNEAGKNITCTVVEAGPCVVTQVKSKDTDGYSALQMAFGERKEKNTPAPLKGHFAAASTTPKTKVVEIRNFDISKSLGDTITIGDVFNEGDKVNIIGTSKGKGFMGVVKRHNFSGVGEATHGQHDRLRAPGSVGASSFPSRLFKGLRMAGRTGNDRVKVRNLKVVKIFAEKNLVLISGAIPGHKGAFVIIEK
jgi:large subunit ribosomal protein L3